MSYSVKNYRDAYGVSQVELAGQLGISPSLLSMIEAGTRNLTGKAAAKFKEIQSREDRFPIEDYGTLEQAVTDILKGYKAQSKRDLTDREHYLISKLHDLQKSTRDLKEDYDRAKHALQYLQILDTKFEKGTMPTTLHNKCVADRFKADTLLRAVLNKKPELKFAEMHGIMAELRYLKQLKKKPGNIFDASPDTFLSAPPTELPPGGENSELDPPAV